jgi:hypothetical protein
MGGECRTHWRDEKWIKYVMENLAVDGRIILEYV